MKNVFLGIDTSNYTTSAAVCDENGVILSSQKRLLPVKEGERGLRQSDALFHHTVALSDIIYDAFACVGSNTLIGVGVSVRPCDREDSYMPCFLAGKGTAFSISHAVDCPCYTFSHQCGHIAAALYSAKRLDLFDKEFIAFHVSGGTTDIVHVKPSVQYVFDIERIGGTLDLNAGQLIDRVGVKMGFSFPAGAEIETAALKFDGCKNAVKPCVNGLFCNLSGAENKAVELFEKDKDCNAAAFYTVSFVMETIKKLIVNVKEMYPDLPIIFAGGVMSCSIIKNALSVYGDFAEPRFSSDNAAGIAYLAYFRHRRYHAES